MMLVGLVIPGNMDRRPWKGIENRRKNRGWGGCMRMIFFLRLYFSFAAYLALYYNNLPATQVQESRMRSTSTHKEQDSLASRCLPHLLTSTLAGGSLHVTG